MAEFDTALGRAIAAARQSAGQSQEKLAVQAGLHPTYISQVERGKKSPTVRAVTAIARALGTVPSELLRRAEQGLVCPPREGRAIAGATNEIGQRPPVRVAKGGP